MRSTQRSLGSFTCESAEISLVSVMIHLQISDAGMAGLEGGHSRERPPINRACSPPRECGRAYPHGPHGSTRGFFEILPGRTTRSFDFRPFTGSNGRPPIAINFAVSAEDNRRTTRSWYSVA